MQTFLLTDLISQNESRPSYFSNMFNKIHIQKFVALSLLKILKKYYDSLNVSKEINKYLTVPDFDSLIKYFTDSKT